MKYSEALRKSIEFRKKYFVGDGYFLCPMCDEVYRRNKDITCCWGCPLHRMEPVYYSLLGGTLLGGNACIKMALDVRNGNRRVEWLILELAMAYEMAGD